MSKLPVITQEYWDENRQRFEAETTTAPIDTTKHTHEFIRRTATEIGCKQCHAGWIDPTGQLIKHL